MVRILILCCMVLTSGCYYGHPHWHRHGHHHRHEHADMVEWSPSQGQERCTHTRRRYAASGAVVGNMACHAVWGLWIWPTIQLS
jgi:hypothetical protein